MSMSTVRGKMRQYESKDSHLILSAKMVVDVDYAQETDILLYTFGPATITRVARYTVFIEVERLNVEDWQISRR